MADPDPSDDAEARAAAKRRRLRARHRNERLKMVANAIDRLGTLTLGGAVLAPIFQRQPVYGQRTIIWILAAVVVHSAALYLIGFQKEEE